MLNPPRKSPEGFEVLGCVNKDVTMVDTGLLNEDRRFDVGTLQCPKERDALQHVLSPFFFFVFLLQRPIFFHYIFCSFSTLQGGRGKMRGNAGEMCSFTNPIIVHATVPSSQLIPVPSEFLPVPHPDSCYLFSVRTKVTIPASASFSHPECSDSGKESLALPRGIFAWKYPCEVKG